MIESLFRLPEETRVLNRDAGLIRERAHQRDLGVGERTDLVARQHEHPRDDLGLPHGDAEHRPVSAELLKVVRRVLAVLEHVGDMHDRTIERDPADKRVAAWRANRVVREPLVLLACRSPERSGVIAIGFQEVDRRPLGVAHVRGAVEDGLEHRHEIRRSPAHHRKRVGERGRATARLSESSLEVSGSAHSLASRSGPMLVTAQTTRK